MDLHALDRGSDGGQVAGLGVDIPHFLSRFISGAHGLLAQKAGVEDLGKGLVDLTVGDAVGDTEDTVRHAVEDASPSQVPAVREADESQGAQIALRRATGKQDPGEECLHHIEADGSRETEESAEQHVALLDRGLPIGDKRFELRNAGFGSQRVDIFEVLIGDGAVIRSLVPEERGIGACGDDAVGDAQRMLRDIGSEGDALVLDLCEDIVEDLARIDIAVVLDADGEVPVGVILRETDDLRNVTRCGTEFVRELIIIDIIRDKAAVFLHDLARDRIGIGDRIVPADGERVAAAGDFDEDIGAGIGFLVGVDIGQDTVGQVGPLGGETVLGAGDDLRIALAGPGLCQVMAQGGGPGAEDEPEQGTEKQNGPMAQ